MGVAILQPADLVVLQLVARAFDFDQFVALLGGACGPEPYQIWQAAAVHHRGLQQANKAQAQVRSGNAVQGQFEQRFA